MDRGAPAGWESRELDTTEWLNNNNNNSEYEQTFSLGKVFWRELKTRNSREQQKKLDSHITYPKFLRKTACAPFSCHVIPTPASQVSITPVESQKLLESFVVALLPLSMATHLNEKPQMSRMERLPLFPLTWAISTFCPGFSTQLPGLSQAALSVCSDEACGLTVPSTTQPSPPTHTYITYTHSRLPGRQSNNWINVSQIQSILKTCSFFFPIVAAKAANGQLSNLGFLEVTTSHMCTYTYSQNPSLIWAGVTEGKGAGRVWPAWVWSWLGVEWWPHDWEVFYTLLFSFSIESYLK